MGYLQIAARIGSALAPWVAKWLQVFHQVLPFAVMGGSAFLCSFLLLWLPETANKETLETLDDQFFVEEKKKTGHTPSKVTASHEAKNILDGMEMTAL